MHETDGWKNSRWNTRGAGCPVMCLGSSVTPRKTTTRWPGACLRPAVATGRTPPLQHAWPRQPQETRGPRCSPARLPHSAFGRLRGGSTGGRGTSPDPSSPAISHWHLSTVVPRARSCPGSSGGRRRARCQARRALNWLWKGPSCSLLGATPALSTSTGSSENPVAPSTPTFETAVSK